SFSGGGLPRASAPASPSDRIDKFNRNYISCRAKDDFEKDGCSPDFRKTYFVQEGKNVVNTMFIPLHDSSRNLVMIKVAGDKATFPLSIPYMEKTAYMRDIVSAMQRHYHFSEDSAVVVISSFNGRRPMPCPVVSLPACEYIAKNLLKNVLQEGMGAAGE
ncbi:MAG: hypothetical protein JXA71_19165, partial [Chitinispirillaceae bacterium]|nr:hypothetical protein [Chitinispirillaceae bacterium]